MQHGVDRSVLQRVAIKQQSLVALDIDELLALHNRSGVFADESPDDGITAHKVWIIHRATALTSTHAPDRIVRTNVEGERSLYLQGSGIDLADIVEHRVDHRTVQRVAIERQLVIALDKDILFTTIKRCRVDALEYPNDRITAHDVLVIHRQAALSMSDTRHRVVRAGIMCDRRLDAQLSGIRFTHAMKHCGNRAVLQSWAVEDWLQIRIQHQFLVAIDLVARLVLENPVEVIHPTHDELILRLHAIGEVRRCGEDTDDVAIAVIMCGISVQIDFLIRQFTNAMGNHHRRIRVDVVAIEGRRSRILQQYRELTRIHLRHEMFTRLHEYPADIVRRVVEKRIVVLQDRPIISAIQGDLHDDAVDRSLDRCLTIHIRGGCVHVQLGEAIAQALPREVRTRFDDERFARRRRTIEIDSMVIQDGYLLLASIGVDAIDIRRKPIECITTHGEVLRHGSVKRIQSREYCIIIRVIDLIDGTVVRRRSRAKRHIRGAARGEGDSRIGRTSDHRSDRIQNRHLVVASVGEIAMDILGIPIDGRVAHRKRMIERGAQERE